MRRPRAVVGLGFVVGLALTLGACGSRSATPTVTLPAPATDPPTPPISSPTTPEPPSPRPAVTPLSRDVDAAECELLLTPGERITTVALTDAVDPAHAPHPSNDSERLLFRQLYETLIRVDCQGRVQPGLASSWRLDASGRTWIVTLRETARFSDGTPVTTSDVLAIWTGSGNELRPQVGRHIESAVPVNDRVVGITLRDELAETPMALADTDLAVAKRARGSRWPLGTRFTEIREDRARPSGYPGRAVISVTARVAGAADLASAIRFVVAPDGDPRDLLDEGVDLLVTRDSAALDYAATLPRFESVPLTWQRTHVFVSPWRTRTARVPSADARQALADDAVRGEAQGAESASWRRALANCELARPQPQDQPAPSTGRIVYQLGDDAARDLAERFVGLATGGGSEAGEILTMLVPGRPSRTFRRATGLTGEALQSALESGVDTGYLVSLDRRAFDACRELEALIGRARWLDPASIVPLVDTRLRAVARRGRSGVTVEWDGGLVISGMGADR